MEYLCKRCGYKATQKGNLVRHLQNIKPCKPLLTDSSLDALLSELQQRDYNEKTYVCEWCSRKFNNSSNKCRHKKTCKASNTEREIAKLKNEVAELRTHGLHQSSVTNNNINCGNTQNNIQINVNAPIKLRDFGCENMGAIPTTLIESLFLDLKFRDLLENLHCDPDYPENHNVRIKSTKRELLEIYRNNKWDIMTFVNGLNELLLQGQRIFKDYYRRNRDKILDEDMDEGDLREILKQLDAIEKLNDDDIKPIRKEIQLMLESYRGQMVVG